MLALFWQMSAFWLFQLEICTSGIFAASSGLQFLLSALIPVSSFIGSFLESLSAS
jgi:hypothetical protein